VAVRDVTRWKMHAALMWLKEENAALSEIACRLGYESEAAFSRAFRRFVGISPRAARRREPRALHNAAVLPKR
jgi:AraC-like DNA-binding protein